MDTHSIDLPMPEAGALRRALDQVAHGGDAVLLVPGDASGILDAIAAELDALPCRVLRVTAAGPGGLSLSGLMAQVTGNLDLEAHDDDVLERGFQALTSGAGGSVALLVDQAGRLQRTALRYIQFACQSGPALRLVLADRAGAPGALQDPALLGDELSLLRTRLAAHAPIFVAGTGTVSAARAATLALPAAADVAAPLTQDVPPGAAYDGLGTATGTDPTRPSPGLAAIVPGQPAAAEAASSGDGGPPSNVPGRSDPVPLPPSRPQRVASAGIPVAAAMPGVLPAEALRTVLVADRAVPSHPVPVSALRAHPAPLSPVPELLAPPRHAGPAGAMAPRRRPVARLAMASLGLAAAVGAGVLIGREVWRADPPGEAPALAGVPATPPLPQTAGTPRPVPPHPVPARQTAPDGAAASPAELPSSGSQAVTPAIRSGDADGSVQAVPDPPPVPSALPPVAPQPPAAAAPSPSADLEATPPRSGGARRAQQESARGRDRAPALREDRQAQRHAARGPDRFGGGGRSRTVPPVADDEWQPGLGMSQGPSPPVPPWEREPDRRPIIGTFTTDSNGMRVFRSAQ